jgi:hypothetical protein
MPRANTLMNTLEGEAPPDAKKLGNLLKNSGLVNASSGGRRTRRKKLRTRK